MPEPAPSPEEARPRLGTSLATLTQQLVAIASPQMRYWNMARQRYRRKLARCRRVLRLSADRAEGAPGHTSGKDRRLGATSPAAAKFTGETDLYGTLAVKGHRCVNPGHSRAAGRSPAILGGRAGQLSAACPPTSTPQGSAAGCPARCGIPVADQSARPPLPPTVLAGTGCVRSVSRALLAQRSAAPSLALGRVHRSGTDARSGHADPLLSFVTVTFARERCFSKPSGFRRSVRSRNPGCTGDRRCRRA